MTPTESLMSAIESFDVDTVENLLKTDFEIEYRNEDRHSVLHTAVNLLDNGAMSVGGMPEALCRLVKVLLESGRFDVNALAHSSNTPLHFAVEYCMCCNFSCDDYKDRVNDIIELLLRNKANINAKDDHGDTPIMMASLRGCSHIVKLLLDWRDERGARVDLNDTNDDGQTVLIMAAKMAHVDVVELLLKHGCLDEFQDHRGFYALHAVIYCGFDDQIPNASSDFLALIGVLASEEMPEVLKRYAAHSEIGKKICARWPKNESIQKIVSMLVTRGRADIKSKDFRGNTVLDLALQSKLFISQKTVEKLKEYVATSGALLNKTPEYPNITLQYTDKLGKTPFHRLSTALPELTLGEKVEIFMHRLNSSPHKEAFEEMTVAKDHRGRTILHYAVMSTGIITDVALKSEDILLLINVLKLKRIINERDNYGKTPLHYCDDEDVYRSLVEQGANEHIQDNYGRTPPDLQKLRNEEHKRHVLHKKVKGFDSWMMWKDSEYAYRDQFSKRICDKLQQFMNKLSDEIRKKDPRFECQPVLIGSAEEGTKTGLPDEFDFNFILTKLSDVCDVVPSPEARSGFVHLKSRYNKAELLYWQANQDFAELFNNGGFLVTTKIACMFRILYLQVLSEPEFWEGEDFFDWDQHNEVGMIYSKQKRQYEEFVTYGDLVPVDYPFGTIQLKLNRPIEGRDMFTLINVDIASCIKINGWLPEEALSSVNDVIKAEGCHLVFDQPQRNYQRVPLSDPFVRISFVPAEGRMIRECSAVARAAYMVGKQLLWEKPNVTYALKTCLFYCIEALKDCTSNSLRYEDINPTELRRFVEKLMQCFHEFDLQDFLPCYMMPSFHLPIEIAFKSKHNAFLNDSSFIHSQFACYWYCGVCTRKLTHVFCVPTPEQLISEHFNREELMRKLSMDSSYIQYRCVQSVSLGTGQVVRSDSQSGSPIRLWTSRKRRKTNANKTKVRRQKLFKAILHRNKINELS